MLNVKRYQCVGNITKAEEKADFVTRNFALCVVGGYFLLSLPKKPPTSPKQCIIICELKRSFVGEPVLYTAQGLS